MIRILPLADAYGFRILPSFAMINNVWTKRPDVASVAYRGHHLMTIPTKMLREPDDRYKTLDGNIQPMYFDREHKLRNWNLIIKNSPHIQELGAKKMALSAAEYEASTIRIWGK